MSILQDPFFVRNLTFGIEDSLISTTGVLVGVAAAKFDVKHIIATGIILIFIEAISMTYGTFLSESNFLKASNKTYTSQQVALYAATMFLSYFGIGLILLLPFALKVPHPIATVLVLAWSLLVILIYVFEKNVKKITILSVIGGFLMAVSIGIGNLLRV